VCRETQCEVLAGVCVGQPLSREGFEVQGADAVIVVEGNTDRCDNPSTRTALRSLRTWHAHKLLSSCEAYEQARATESGACAAKGGSQGELGRGPNAPDTEPGKCAPGPTNTDGIN
jgi:hypothetical protein